MMKYLLIILLLVSGGCRGQVIFPVVAGEAVSAGRVTDINWSGKTIDIIGDSYVTGYPVTTPQRWTTIFCAAVGATENNLGLNGRGIEADPGCTGYSALTNAAIPSYSVGHELIMALGTNDVARDATTFDVVDFKTAYQLRINNALSKGWPPTSIILFNTYSLWDWSAFTTSCGSGTKDLTLIGQYNTAIEELADDNGLWYFDVYAEMAGFLITDYQLDLAHLSVAGYSKLANIVINRL